MDIKNSYNEWAAGYDQMINKTRDLEARALREVLEPLHFENCLELGCGTGKNTVWLQHKALSLTCIDFSGEMIAKARQKITAAHVKFTEADLEQPWNFALPSFYDMISFSLVLEHIEDLDAIFLKAQTALKPGGFLYIGELHPYRQYKGSKARFDTPEGVHELTCFMHHMSDYTGAAKRQGLNVVEAREYFDDEEKTGLPRLLVFLWQKNKPGI